jgi:hypothetical protein
MTFLLDMAAPLLLVLLQMLLVALREGTAAGFKP